MKPWYTSRTVWASSATIVLAVALFADGQLRAGLLPVSPEVKVWLLFGLGVLMLVLRLDTRTALGREPPPDDLPIRLPDGHIHRPPSG